MKTSDAPEWLKVHFERQLRRENPVASNATPEYKRGAALGFAMRQLYDAFDKPDTGQAAVFNAGRQYVAGELAKVAFLPRAAALAFLRGYIYAIRCKRPNRGDEITDVIDRTILREWDKLQACRTNAERVVLLKSRLPQDTVAGWSEALHAAFPRRIEQKFRRIRLSTARPGRPAKHQ
jgi:hypothetical protein